jgi:hypothetical protein
MRVAKFKGEKPILKNMEYTLYRESDGEYLGGTSLESNLPSPIPVGEAVRINGSINTKTHVWSKSAKDWVPVSAPRTYSISGFMGLLTLSERVLYYASRTDLVQTVKDAITGVRDMEDHIDLDDPVTSQMLQYLVDAGVLTAERKTEILS